MAGVSTSGEETNQHLNNVEKYNRQPSCIEAANHLLHQFLSAFTSVNGEPGLPNSLSTHRGDVSFTGGISNISKNLQNSLNLFKVVTCYVGVIFLPTDIETNKWVFAAVSNDFYGSINLKDTPAPAALYDAVANKRNLQINEEFGGRCWEVFYAPLKNAGINPSTGEQILAVLATAREICPNPGVPLPNGCGIGYGPYGRCKVDPCRVSECCTAACGGACNAAKINSCNVPNWGKSWK